MKRIILITAILLTAFTVDAQSNRSRSERQGESKSAPKKEVKSNDRSSTQQERRNSSTYQKDDREKSSSTKQTSRTTRPGEERKVSSSDRSGVERQGNRTSYQNRELQGPRVRVEHPESDNSRKVENVNREASPREDYAPKRGERYEAQRRTYSYSHSNRVVRPAPKTYYAYKPLEYRREHYVYRMPPRRTIVWTPKMYREYVYLYPEYRLWYYPYGYHIHTVSAYDADRYIGEIARVYGEVFDVWYSRSTDEYYLYIGAPYPYQDFSIVMEGHDARRFSSRPVRYFTGRDIAATGLIGVFEGKPEMFIRKWTQVNVY